MEARRASVVKPFVRSMRMDRLAAIEAFVLVVDTGSFSAAARRLNVTAGGPEADRTIGGAARCQTVGAYDTRTDDNRGRPITMKGRDARLKRKTRRN
jgi:hypothetical protein